MSLEKMSLTELRGIAQSLGVKDVFAKAPNELRTEIKVKQETQLPIPETPIPKPVYDARLMSKPPSKNSNQTDLEALLAVHMERGLRISYPSPEQWLMQYKDREDSGTMRQSLANIIRCADKLMR